MEHLPEKIFRFRDGPVRMDALGSLQEGHDSFASSNLLDSEIVVVRHRVDLDDPEGAWEIQEEFESLNVVLFVLQGIPADEIDNSPHTRIEDVSDGLFDFLTGMSAPVVFVERTLASGLNTQDQVAAPTLGKGFKNLSPTDIRM